MNSNDEWPDGEMGEKTIGICPASNEAYIEPRSSSCPRCKRPLYLLKVVPTGRLEEAEDSGEIWKEVAFREAGCRIGGVQDRRPQMSDEILAETGDRCPTCGAPVFKGIPHTSEGVPLPEAAVLVPRPTTWQCERHPGVIYPHDDCPGPGMPLAEGLDEAPWIEEGQ